MESKEGYATIPIKEYNKLQSIADKWEQGGYWSNDGGKYHIVQKDEVIEALTKRIDKITEGYDIASEAWYMKQIELEGKITKLQEMKNALQADIRRTERRLRPSFWDYIFNRKPKYYGE